MCLFLCVCLFIQKQAAIIFLHDVTLLNLWWESVWCAVYTPIGSTLTSLSFISINEADLILFTSCSLFFYWSWLFTLHVKAHSGHVLARLSAAQQFTIQHHGWWRRPEGQARDLFVLCWDYWLAHITWPTWPGQLFWIQIRLASIHLPLFIFVMII